MIQWNYQITSCPLLTGGSLRSQEGKLSVCQHPVCEGYTDYIYSRRYECQLAADGMKQLRVNFTDPDTTFQPARVKEDEQGSTTSAEFNRVLMRVCEQILQC